MRPNEMPDKCSERGEFIVTSLWISYVPSWLQYFVIPLDVSVVFFEAILKTSKSSSITFSNSFYQTERVVEFSELTKDEKIRISIKDSSGTEKICEVPALLLPKYYFWISFTEEEIQLGSGTTYASLVTSWRQRNPPYGNMPDRLVVSNEIKVYPLGLQTLSNSDSKFRNGEMCTENKNCISGICSHSICRGKCQSASDPRPLGICEWEYNIPVGKACEIPYHCDSRNCSQKICLENCHSKNDTRVGASCKWNFDIPVGYDCRSSVYCNSGICRKNICAQRCTSRDDTRDDSGYCLWNVDIPLGKHCIESGHCENNNCEHNRCVEKCNSTEDPRKDKKHCDWNNNNIPIGNNCFESDHCQSGLCEANYCVEQCNSREDPRKEDKMLCDWNNNNIPIGKHCTLSEHCQNGICEGFRCVEKCSSLNDSRSQDELHCDWYQNIPIGYHCTHSISCQSDFCLSDKKICAEKCASDQDARVNETHCEWHFNIPDGFHCVESRHCLNGNCFNRKCTTGKAVSHATGSDDIINVDSNSGIIIAIVGWSVAFLIFVALCIYFVRRRRLQRKSIKTDLFSSDKAIPMISTVDSNLLGGKSYENVTLQETETSYDKTYEDVTLHSEERNTFDEVRMTNGDEYYSRSDEEKKGTINQESSLYSAVHEEKENISYKMKTTNGDEYYSRSDEEKKGTINQESSLYSAVHEEKENISYKMKTTHGDEYYSRSDEEKKGTINQESSLYSAVHEEKGNMIYSIPSDQFCNSDYATVHQISTIYNDVDP